MTIETPERELEALRVELEKWGGTVERPDAAPAPRRPAARGARGSLMVVTVTGVLPADSPGRLLRGPRE